MRPVWDFNLGMGNCSIGYSGSTEGWSYANRASGVGYWADRLMSDPSFKQKVTSRWQLLRNTVWSNANLTAFIDNTKNGISVYCDTFESAIDEHLKVWLLERATWIDDQLQ